MLPYMSQPDDKRDKAQLIDHIWVVIVLKVSSQPFFCFAQLLSRFASTISSYTYTYIQQILAIFPNF